MPFAVHERVNDMIGSRVGSPSEDLGEELVFLGIIRVFDGLEIAWVRAERGKK